jgi:hypothetical protein
MNMNNLYYECPTCLQISDIHPCPICHKETRRKEPVGGLFRSTIEIPIPRFMGWHRVLIDQGTHMEEAKIEGFAHDARRKVIQVTLKVPPYSIGRRCLTQRYLQGKLVDEIDHGNIIPSQDE